MSILLLFGTAEPGDAMIIILFTLFAASTVNERIIDFIKLQTPVLCLKSFNYREEVRRSKKLWLLAFGMGIVTTAILDINFVKLLTENKEEIGISLVGFVDWLKDFPYPLFPAALGYLFTALFISLGSKFWHDLLDLVLFVKDSKRKIKDFNPQGISEIKQIEKYREEDLYAMARKALEANRKNLGKDYPGASLNVGYEYVGEEYRLCVQVMHREARQGQAANGAKRITFVTDYGYVFTYPIVVNFPSRVRTVNDTDGKAQAGGGLFNSATSNNVGTFGCIVKNKKNKDEYLLLTCYHCVRVRGVHAWDYFGDKERDTEVKYLSSLNNQEPLIVGRIQSAHRDGRMDIALIKPDRNDFVSDYRWFSYMTVPLGFRAVTIADARNRTRIWFSGVKSGNCEGYIINLGFSEDIKYAGDTDLHRLHNLIVFSQTSAAPYLQPCEKGDSGAIILDAETHQALGMIVARDDQFGYAIPIKDILELHELALLADSTETVSD